MSDNELLLAMSNLIQAQIEPLKKGMEHVRQELKEAKQEIREVKQKQQQISITLENDILPRLQTIESCYTSTYQRYSEGIEDLEAIKADMDIVKKVVAEHSERLQKIS